MMKGYTIFSRSLFERIEITSEDKMANTVLDPRRTGLPTLKDQRRERLGRTDDALHRRLVARIGAARTHGTYGQKSSTACPALGCASSRSASS
jgi:hypothetical protein